MPAGDFDGDGRPDLAFACTTEQGAGRVRVFRQTELGFEPKRFADTGIRAVQLCAADLDGDGAVDVVVACKGETREASLVFWARPGGGFEAEPAVLASSGACDVAIADLDGDGRPEVVICQHKSDASFTTESLVYACSAGRRFGPARPLVSHDARRCLVGRPDGGHPRLVLINHFARTSRDDVPIYVYRGGGGDEGYASERRLEVVASGAPCSARPRRACTASPSSTTLADCEGHRAQPGARACTA